MDRRELLLAGVGLPFGIAVGARAPTASAGGGPLAFVTADHESHVVVFDPAAARVVGRIATSPGPRSIENVEGATALVAHTASGRLSLVDGPSRRVRSVVEGFEAPRYTAGHGFPFACVTDSKRAEVVTVDIERSRVAHRASVPGPARHITITPNGQTVWTALGSRASKLAVLEVGDAGRLRLARTIPTPFLAHDVVAATDGEHVWVTAGDRRRIAIYDIRGRRPRAILAAGRAPQHVAFVGGRAFVASGDDGTVRVHRLSGELIDELRVPSGSYNVTAFSVGSAVTSSLSRGTVAVLDDRSGVRAVRRIARAAHDVCMLTAS